MAHRAQVRQQQQQLPSKRLQSLRGQQMPLQTIEETSEADDEAETTMQQQHQMPSQSIEETSEDSGEIDDEAETTMQSTPLTQTTPQPLKIHLDVLSRAVQPPLIADSSAVISQVRFCPECGNRFQSQAKFCCFCGTSIDAILMDLNLQKIKMPCNDWLSRAVFAQ